MRRGEFAGCLVRGQVLSELLELKPLETLRWAQRASSATLSLARSGSDPELSISLDELRLSETAARDGYLADGSSPGWLSCTEVRLSYAFESVRFTSAAVG